MPELFTNSDKPIVIDFCKKYIKDNGYVNVDWAIGQSVKDKKFENSDQARFHKIRLLSYGEKWDVFKTINR